MENNAPFYIGQKVVALKDGKRGGIKKGDVCTVVYQVQCTKCKVWVVGVAEAVGYAEGSGCKCGQPVWHLGYKNYCGNAKCFAPINPYSNSVSLELAQEAVKERVEVDGPVKEVVNN